MRSERIVCDGCGAVKQETNHWYSVWLYCDRFLIKTLGTLSDIPDGVKVLDLCGQSCVLKSVSEFMSAKAPQPAASIDGPKTPEEKFEATVGMIVDKLENGEASQLGDEEFSYEIWAEVKRRIGAVCLLRAKL